MTIKIRIYGSSAGRADKMSDLAEMHDTALEYENDIDGFIDTIRNYRIKMIDKKDAEILKSIIPVLDILNCEIEQYKEWLEEI